MCARRKRRRCGLEKKMKHGVSIMLINGLVVAVVLLFSLGIDVTNRMARSRYDQTVASQKAFIACNDASKVFQQQSDELTLNVNSYVESGSADALVSYFAIIDNQLREKEIEAAEQYDVDCSALKDALAISNALEQREIHAFALIASADGTIHTAPHQVQEYPLPLKERKLTSEEKVALAKRIINGGEYYTYKNKIYEKLNQFETGVLEQTENRLVEETASISRLLNIQNAFEIIEELAIVCLAFLLYRQVTVVLRKYIRSISQDEAITPGGTSELRYLAAVINQYVALQSQRQKELRSIAEMDALTQVPNRHALEDFMNRTFQRKGMHGALIILDVDDFKRINDNYGHDLGDVALQNLVAQIHECIRSDDFLARFGGDEFVIWMDGIVSGDVGAIKEKIEEVNHRMILVANMTMQISMSAGVTFCQAGDAYKDALRRADTALYEMKRTGKHGCAVYEELEN